jgi:hypothetical protein
MALGFDERRKVTKESLMYNEKKTAWKRKRVQPTYLNPFKING